MSKQYEVEVNMQKACPCMGAPVVTHVVEAQSSREAEKLAVRLARDEYEQKGYMAFTPTKVKMLESAPPEKN